MTTVFVHGVPECSAIWGPLLDRLDIDDAITLSPPGFGVPVPDGFDPTSDSYAEWLVGEIEQLGGPVTLVGHDWGGAHVVRAAITRPDLVDRLVTDVGGLFDPSYVWHDTAQAWQTDEVGEAAVEGMAGAPNDALAAGFVDAGMTQEAAQACAEAVDNEMGRCILRLYRSAVQPNLTRWGDQYAALDDRPDTIVVAPAADHYTGGVELARNTANRFGASFVELPGLGHWWMMEDPEAAAAALAGAIG